MKLTNLFFYYKMKPRRWNVNKMDESNSKMAAGCNVSLYRFWTVQIGLFSCWEEAVHTCTLKHNKDHQLEDTRLPLLGEKMFSSNTSGSDHWSLSWVVPPQYKTTHSTSTCRYTSSTRVLNTCTTFNILQWCISQSIYDQPLKNMNLQINCIHGELGLCISGLANFNP
jgi:hypothetical protein